MRWRRLVLVGAAILGMACASDLVQQHDQQGWHYYWSGQHGLLNRGQAIDSARSVMASYGCTKDDKHPRRGSIMVSVLPVGQMSFYCGHVSRDSAHRITRAFNQRASSWIAGAHSMAGYWDLYVVDWYDCVENTTITWSYTPGSGHYEEMEDCATGKFTSEYVVDAESSLDITIDYSTSCVGGSEVDAVYYTNDDQPAAPPDDNGPFGSGWGAPANSPPPPPTHHIASVAISPSYAIVDSGSVSSAFTISGSYDDGSTFVLADTLTIANHSVVQNDDAGTVLGVGVGSTTVSYTLKTGVGSATITATATVDVSPYADDPFPGNDTGIADSFPPRCNTTDTLGFSGKNARWCHGSAPTTTQQARIDSAIAFIRGHGVPCVAIADTLAGVLSRGNIHILTDSSRAGFAPEDSTSTGAALGAANGYIGVGVAWADTFYNVHHTIKSGRTGNHVSLASILVHEADHLNHNLAGGKAHIDPETTANQLACTSYP